VYVYVYPTGGSEERSCRSEEQEKHQFSDADDVEEDEDEEEEEEEEDDDEEDDDEEEDDEEEDEEELCSHDDPASSCSSDTRASTGASSCSRQSQQGAPAALAGEGPSLEAAPPRPWSSRRAVFWRRGFSPGREGCSPSRSLSPRLELPSRGRCLSPGTDLSSPGRCLSPSPERGPSPAGTRSPPRPPASSCYGAWRAPPPGPQSQYRPPVSLPWESPGPLVSLSSLSGCSLRSCRGRTARLEAVWTSEPNSRQWGSHVPSDILTVCLLPLQESGGTSGEVPMSPEATPFPPAFRLSFGEGYPGHRAAPDRVFSHLPLHSQQQARVPYLMIPIGGIQMVQARRRPHPLASASSPAPPGEGPSSGWSGYREAGAGRSGPSADARAAFDCSVTETTDSQQYGSLHSSAHSSAAAGTTDLHGGHQSHPGRACRGRPPGEGPGGPGDVLLGTGAEEDSSRTHRRTP